MNCPPSAAHMGRGLQSMGMDAMKTDVVQGIESAYSERTDFLVVALTGRTGSGCSTTASFLTRDFVKLPIVDNESVLGAYETRKLKIASEFLEKHWVPFQIVTVSSIIFAYLIRAEEPQLRALLTRANVPSQVIDLVTKIRADLHDQSGFSDLLSILDSNDREKRSSAWKFFDRVLQPAASKFKQVLGDKYSTVFQAIGDNIRASGDAYSEKVDPAKMFALVKGVKRLAKAAFYHNKETGVPSTRIVIDAIRNPLELVYLRDQFAAFYSIAVTAEDEDRVSRLESMGLQKARIKEIDEKEYSSEKKSLSSYEEFVSQNLQECIQKSDIFLANPGRSGDLEKNSRLLNTQIVRYVALMIRPGLITPTRDERCMQLAFVAKLNSGCISRQVGAAVADKSFSIKAVGWNDVPKGQTPCLLRNVDDLLSGGDGESFSDFEKRDLALRADLNNEFANRRSMSDGAGIPCAFCFKDAYNRTKDAKNQVHTRSLHAEENAFLQLAKTGNSGIEGGVLFTTASPCELCSKKAFQLGIVEVVFVDPYPGISATHVLASGIGPRPKLRLFSGAIGHAYHRIYEPILPIKDEIYARMRSSVA